MADVLNAGEYHSCLDDHGESIPYARNAATR